jgi:tetratricopeptide (TPR) repeat protein
MPVITIREQHRTETGFAAILSFDGRVNYPITITEPFTRREEERLEWYFEEWLVYPMLDKVKAARVAESVKAYGEKLFEQVFKANFDAYSEYRQLRGKLAQVQIEIESQTPEFQALHWEALCDPDLPRPFAVDCVMLRKSTKPASVPAQVQPSPVINLLVVTARPKEEKDVGYRTISRPLIEVIEQSQLRVKVELLRPGTYEALERHLEEKGAGFYHIIHFDAHGGLMRYEEMQAGAKANRYTYQQRYGREDLPPYEGVKAFLFLEGETNGKADPVEAQELADLLTGKGIPVCILNACQSGKQVSFTLTPPLTRGAGGVNPDDSQTSTPPNPPLVRGGEDGDNSRETSLGSRLMAAGMQMVVAMGYSVTVTAASLLMEKLYRELFNNKGISEAIRLGRRELFNRKSRQAYYNQTIDLEDWLLPVVYSNQAVNLNLREFTPQEEETFFESLGRQYRFPQPEYGFVGRDLEILKIEKALLRHNILLLQGMGGTGKTTLLNYLREWWQRTHFAQDVFYFGYDQKAWTLAQILHDIGKRVYDRFEMSRFQAMSQAAQVQKLVAKLKTEPHILILDNLESVTGQRLAIQNTLSKKKQAELREFLALLVDGKTRVVLGSRSGEEWLQGTTFKTNVYHLQGLDPQSRSVLAEKILERHVVVAHRISKIREDADFARLMKLLAGYPLAMEVVLANLRQQSPQEILEKLQAADVNLDNKRECGDKTESILKCVEYSYSNLSPEAQKLLLCLAPFSGFIYRDAIPLYINELKMLEPLKDYAFDKFDEAVQEAINWGLLSPDLDSPTWLRIQPVFPYFLKTNLEAQGDAIREAVREAFKSHYQGVAGGLKLLMNSHEPQQRQLGQLSCELEYENLYEALKICLERQEDISIFFCLHNYLSLISDSQNGLSLAEFVCHALDRYQPTFQECELGHQIGLAFDRLAYSYQETKQYQQAKKTYQKVLEIYQSLRNEEERQKQLWSAGVYHQLGKISQELRDFEEALRNYQQSLEISRESGERYKQAKTYHNLGSVFQELREFEQAWRNYEQALEIWSEFGDRYSQSLSYHNLGMVAQNLREFEEARRNYQQALDICLEFGDRYNQAKTYNQLGLVAQELHEFEEARRNYQQSLEIKIEYGDRYSQAATYHNLGRISQFLGEFEEARRNYQQALDIRMEFGDRYSQAGNYNQLGRIAQELGTFEEARHNYQQALEIFIEFGDYYSQALTYNNLGVLAVAQEDYTEARANLQKALEIFIEYKDECWAAIAREALERLSNKSENQDQR